MSEWKEVELIEIVKPGKGMLVSGPFGSNISSKFFVEVGVPVIRGNNLSKGIKKFNDDGYVFITEQKAIELKNCEAVEDDIIFTAAGTLGQIGIMPKNKKYKKYIISNKQIRLRCNLEIVSPLFIYYKLVEPSFNELIVSQNKGSSIPLLTLGSIKWLKILLPPLPTQQRIASILSAYDDLIENNLKRIKLLEEIAQCTYEEWFVKFRINGVQLEVGENGLPEGWEKKSLTTIAEFLNGFAFKPSDWFEVGHPIIKIKEMKNGIGNDTPRNEGGRIPLRYLIKKGDILFSWSASLEVIIWQGVDGWLNQHLFKVTPIEEYPREFVHQALLFCLEEFNNLTTGATMKHIKRQELDFVKVAIPNGNILKQFENQINPIQNQILNLAHQNHLLKESRDILLPRLMSGKVGV
jgi:type I restriction enzyme S subunit